MPPEQPTYYYQEPKKSRKKLILIIVSLLVLIIIPTILFTKDRGQRESQVLPEQNIVTVTLDGERGFSPRYLKIPKGTKVVWSNQDSVYNKVMQVAANTTDQSAPQGFGSQTAVGLNGQYEYTFDEATTLNYRNEADPLQNGTIEVSD